MWNKSILQSLFKRVFVLYAVLMLAAVLTVQFYITDTVRDSHIRDMKENLAVQATLVSRNLSFKPTHSPDNLCRQLKEETGARVTIIALNGKVLGDSDTASAQMENHRLRQEIQQAEMDGTGTAIRYSDTVKYNFLYVAKKIMRQSQPVGYVRIGVPLQNIDHTIDLLSIKILTVVFFALVATAFFSVWQVDRIRKLTGQIRDFSRSLVRGEVGKKMFLGKAGEFDEIAESLNTMSAELHKSIIRAEEEKDRLAVILSSIPDALLISDKKDVVRMSSAAARNLFGDIPLEGKLFIEIVRNREFSALLDDVKKERKPGVTEFMLDHPEERYCVVRVSPLLYRGESSPSGFVAIFHDITRLKKLEQVRKDFVANISHEIKTPITAIQGFAETLLEGALKNKAHALKFIETIKANSSRINSLVDDLMTISKIELGVEKVDKAPLVFDDAAEAVLTMLRDKAAQKKLSLTLSILPNLGMISADRDRLIQILTNLVDNAIKFTDSGGVTFGAAEENGKTVLFVKDTGIGIPAKHLARLGERFYRVDAGRSRNMGGTGLGLAIVKHLVKAHGWDMRIESTPGKGTKVTIFIA
jgi:two-component system, OmpR family, phosphate regulon sensor histidine kinase PhoR